jgi:acetylglutamate kinase
VALNVDGDRLAMEVAVATSADRLLIFSDTPGFMRNVSDPSSLLPRIRLSDIDAALAFAGGRAGVKLRAAAQAVQRGVAAVGILDGRGERPLTDALKGAGTWIQA